MWLVSLTFDPKELLKKVFIERNALHRILTFVFHRQCHPRARKVDIIGYQVEPNFMNRRKYLPPSKTTVMTSVKYDKTVFISNYEVRVP